jgi:hypothetical protein
MAIVPLASAVSTAYSAIPADKKAKAMAWMRKATAGTVTNIKKAMDYAASNEAGAAIVAEGLVRHGAPVGSLSDAFVGPNGAAIRASLVALATTLIQSEDTGRPGLNASQGDIARDALRKELCGSLIRHFGSLENARRVQTALSTLRQEDFDWYRAVVGR